MLRSCSDTRSRTARRREGGVYIPLLAGIIVTLLLVGGLVIDSANLYFRRDQMQAGADLAVQAGLGFRILKGWAWFRDYDDAAPHDPYDSQDGPALTQLDHPTDSTRTDQLLTIVRNTFVGNTPSSRCEGGLTITPQYSLTTDVVQVTVNCRIRLLLLQLVPGWGQKFSTITVSSQTQLSPANIVLMLDHSGSMRCPASDLRCACRTADSLCQTAYRNGLTNRANPTSPRLTESRVFTIGRAARRFASFFNPHRDRIAVVRFQTLAETTFPFQIGGTARPFGGDQSTLTSFYTALDATDAQGNTNITAALENGISEIAQSTTPKMFGNSNPLDDQPTFGVLFTDGAPSAGNFRLTNPGPGMNVAGQRDWLSYTVEWNTGTSRYNGPSPLVLRSNTLNYLNFTGGAPPAGATLCGSMAAAPANFGNAMRGAAGPCVNRWDFSPAPGRTVAHNIDPNSAAQLTTLGQDASPLVSAQQYYHSAIEQADLFRSRRGVLFTVGFGMDGLATGNNDPYQDPDNDFSRKEFFLKRLAFDLDHATAAPEFDPHQITLNDPSDPRTALTNNQITVGYEGYQPYATAAAQFGKVKGLYEGTDDPNRIHSLFEQLAKRILLRLTH